MKDKLNIGYIGIGRRGSRILKNCISIMDDVNVLVLCDIVDSAIQEGVEILAEKGKPVPETTHDYRDILKRDDIDALFVMTGWNDRCHIIKEAMIAGIPTGFEVGCAFDLSDCYELLQVYEETKTPIMMLENCCYGRFEMMALNVKEQGLFGEIVHCEGGYHHDLVACHEIITDHEDSDRHYRIESYKHRNCEQYPTHELGPICKVLGINRGNRFLTLSSFASKAVALKERSIVRNGPDSKWSKFNYKQGDIITTILTCANGETVKLCLDTTAPRAHYSRNFTVRGSLGMCSEDSSVLFFEGMEEPCRNNLEEMYEKYDHPLHTAYIKEGVKEGHGGIDYLVCRAFVESVMKGIAPPIDAYDSLLWLSIAPLSEMSIAKGGMPVEVPDFTRGKWIKREPVTESKYCLDKVCK